MSFISKQGKLESKNIARILHLLQNWNTKDSGRNHRIYLREKGIYYQENKSNNAIRNHLRVSY